MKYLIFIYLIFIASTFSANTSKDNSPLAKDGTLDLTAFDWKHNDQIALDGEWEFYWKEFIFPEDFANKKNNPHEFINVPGIWNNKIINNEKLDGKGYATYRLQIKTSGLTFIPAIKIKYMSSAYLMFVNEKIISNGVVGKTKKSSFPKWLPQTRVLRLENDRKIEIVLHVSNFHRLKGGVPLKIFFGKVEYFRSHDTIQIFLNGLFIGFFFIIGLYHLILFFYSRVNKANLYFALFCIGMAVKVICTEKYLIMIFPKAPLFQFDLKLGYLTFYTAVPFFVLFLKHCFQEEYKKIAVLIFVWLGIIFSAIVIVTPDIIFEYTLIPYQTIFLLACIYSFYVIIQSFRHKRRNALLSLIGFSLIFISALNDNIHDILKDYGINVSFYAVPFGLLLFIIFHSICLSREFSQLYQKSNRVILDEEIIDEKVKEHDIKNREKEIIYLLKEGYTYREIAEQLFISYHTVRTHVRNIYDKIGAKNKTNMLNYLFSNRDN